MSINDGIEHQIRCDWVLEIDELCSRWMDSNQQLDQWVYGNQEMIDGYIERFQRGLRSFPVSRTTPYDHRIDWE